jgi:hypothetical protein
MEVYSVYVVPVSTYEVSNVPMVLRIGRFSVA